MDVGTEIKSHSSMLYNLEISNLLSELNISAKQHRAHPEEGGGKWLLSSYAILSTLWRNVKCVLRTNRKAMRDANLEVHGHVGLLTPDVMLALIRQRFMTISDEYPLTVGEAWRIVEQLDATEEIIRDALNAMGYFARFDMKTKPDINAAADSYLAELDKLTPVELERIAGRPAQIIKKITEGTAEDSEQAMIDAEAEEDDAT